MMNRKFIDEKNIKPTFIIIISVVIGGYFTLSYFDVFITNLFSTLLIVYKEKIIKISLISNK